MLSWPNCKIKSKLIPKLRVLEGGFIAKSYFGHPTVSYIEIFYLCFKENNAHITNQVFTIFFVFV
jgi:hypothetical protein